jgi:GDP-L-fucose synthase
MRLLRQKGYRPVSVTRRQGTDIRNLNALTASLKRLKPDVILNCAGHVGSVHYVTRQAADVINDNLRMCLNLYQAVAAVCPGAKIVNPFGNCSYPGDAVVQKESEWQAGPVHDSVLAFAFGKRTQYAIAESYRKQYGINTVNWIVCNPYGPERDINLDKLHALNGIIVRMICAQKKGDKEFVIWGTGTPVREWLYIDDSARMMVHSVDHVDSQLWPVNVAQNKGWTITEIAKRAAKELDYRVKFVYDTAKPDGAPVKVMDDTLFRSKFPDFKFTPLDTGIRTTVAHFKKLLA